jgi:hypothetical protein
MTLHEDIDIIGGHLQHLEKQMQEAMIPAWLKAAVNQVNNDYKEILKNASPPIEVTIPRVTLSREGFFALYNEVTNVAYFMAVDILGKESEQRHDREVCDGIYYPYLEEYGYKPDMVCLLCGWEVDTD